MTPIINTNHWGIKKNKERSDIYEGQIEYVIQHSKQLRDKRWPAALNAICRVPSTGKVLKVVYKIIGKNKIKIITAYWIDR